MTTDKAAPVGAVPQGDWWAKVRPYIPAEHQDYVGCVMSAALASQAARMGELRELVAKWRAEADSFTTYTTAPAGLTWDHGAIDAKREDARQLEAAIDKLRGEAG